MKKILSLFLILCMLMMSFSTVGVLAAETDSVIPTLIGVTKDYALISTNRALTEGDYVALGGKTLSFGENLSSNEGVYEYKISFGENALQNGVPAELLINDLGYKLTLDSLLEDDFSTNKGWVNGTVADGNLTVNGTVKAYLNGNGTDAPSFEQQKLWKDYVLEVSIPASANDSRMYFYKYATVNTVPADSLLYVARHYSGKYTCGVSTSGVVSSLYTTATLGAAVGTETTITNGYLKVFANTSPWTNGANIVLYEGENDKFVDINGENIIRTKHTINNSTVGAVAFSNQGANYTTTVDKLHIYTVSKEIVNRSSATLKLEKAERLTKDYVYLTFNKKPLSDIFTIDGKAVSAEIIEHSFDNVVYKVDISSEFLDGGNHYISVDGDEVYKFTLTKILSDDFSTNKGWANATVDTTAGTLTVAGSANAYPTFVDMTGEKDYILDIDIDSSTPANARMLFRKYTPDNEPTDSLSYILRNYSSNYIVATAVKLIEKSAELFSTTAMNGTYGTDNTFQTIGYMMSLGSTNPWANGVNAKYYETDGKKCVDLDGKQIFATDVVSATASTGGINISNWDNSYSMVLDSVNVYRAEGEIPSEDSAELVSIYAVNDDYIEATFSSELKFSEKVYIDGIDATPESAYKVNENGYVYRIDINDYTDGKKHIVDFKGTQYSFTYEELLNDSFDAATNPGWKNAVYNGDGTLTVEKKNIAYLDGDGITSPSFAQQQNWHNYVLEVKVNKETPKASRMFFVKYATSQTPQANALSYAIRDYSSGTKFIAGIAYYGAITASDTYSSIVNATAGQKYEGTNKYSVVLGNVCPWQQTVGTDSSVEFEMYEINGVNRLDAAGTTIAETSVISGNSTAGAIAFSNFENTDGKKLILDSVRVFKVTLDEIVNTASVESVVTTSDKIIVNFSNEVGLPVIELKDTNGDAITPANIDTDGNKVYISTENIPFGKVFTLKVTYGKSGVIYDKVIRRTIKFEEDAKGSDITNKWNITFANNEFEVEDSNSTVTYKNGTIECVLESGVDLELSPKYYDEVCAKENQTVEYTIDGITGSYDISAFMLSENIKYHDTKAQNFFIKYQNNQTRMRHTYDNASTYWANATVSKDTLGGGQKNVVQIADSMGAEVYANNVLIAKGRNCVDESNKALAYAKIPSKGTFGWRFVNSNNENLIINISNVKVMSVEEVKDSYIGTITASYNGETADITAHINNEEEIKQIIIALYDKEGNVVGIKIINTLVDNTAIAEDIAVNGVPAYTKVFLWDSFENMIPLCEAGFKSF